MDGWIGRIRREATYRLSAHLNSLLKLEDVGVRFYVKGEFMETPGICPILRFSILPSPNVQFLPTNNLKPSQSISIANPDVIAIDIRKKTL